MIPITAVIRPPVRNEICRGDRLEKSFDGETTLAAMFVEICAMSADRLDTCAFTRMAVTCASTVRGAT